MGRSAPRQPSSKLAGAIHRSRSTTHGESAQGRRTELAASIAIDLVCGRFVDLDATMR